MKPTQDQLAALLSEKVIPYAERINMPYLGYYLLRETLSAKLLGESETPILYWIGKELGEQIPIDSATGLIIPFIRLGLGKLEVRREADKQWVFVLTHSIFDYIAAERLGQQLSFECGLIAGAITRWQQHEAAASLELYPAAPGKKAEVHITVQLEQ